MVISAGFASYSLAAHPGGDLLGFGPGDAVVFATEATAHAGSRSGGTGVAASRCPRLRPATSRSPGTSKRSDRPRTEAGTSTGGMAGVNSSTGDRIPTTRRNSQD